MPEISRFYGISIQFFYRDHNPPHFHAVYAGYRAVVDIETLKISEGKLPRKQALLVVQWAFLHREELMQAWEAASNEQVPKRIRPLK